MRLKTFLVSTIVSSECWLFVQSECETKKNGGDCNCQCECSSTNNDDAVAERQRRRREMDNMDGNNNNKHDDEEDSAAMPDILILLCTQSFKGEELVEDILLEKISEANNNNNNQGFDWTVQVKLVDEAGIDWTEESIQQQQQIATDSVTNNYTSTMGSVTTVTTTTVLTNQARALLIVASTYGDGDPPNHAAEFADWLARGVTTHKSINNNATSTVDAEHSFSQNNAAKDKVHPTATASSSVSQAVPPFAVFGLGDSTYAHYCAFADFVQDALTVRAAPQKSFLPLAYGDVQGDQSGDFAVWSDQVVKALSDILLPHSSSSSKRQGQQEEPVVEEMQRRAPFASTGTDWRRSALQPDTVVATFEGSQELLESDNEEESLDRSVLHVSLFLPSAKTNDGDQDYFQNLQPGDHLGIYPHNPPKVVRRALNWLEISGNMTTRIVQRQKGKGGDVIEYISALEFLTEHVDLMGRATPSALRALLPFAGTLELRALARDLTFVDTKPSEEEPSLSVPPPSSSSSQQEAVSLFDQWLGGRRLTKFDLAVIFECRPSLQALARAIGPMLPRLYSIATVSSSPSSLSTLDAKTNETRTHFGLCVAVADGGLCTNYLAGLNPGSEVKVFGRKSRFHFQDNNSPSLLIAAGSGIGPYIGFLGQQAMVKHLPNSLEGVYDSAVESSLTNLSNIRLFFGSRSPADILYKDRLPTYQRQGSNIHYAFSRVSGEPKVYAQQLLLKGDIAPLVWNEIFDRQGRLYVCGRLELCEDVKHALQELAISRGNFSEDEALGYIRTLEQQDRLLTDCWSVTSAPALTSTAEKEFSNFQKQQQFVPHIVSRLARHHQSSFETKDSGSRDTECAQDQTQEFSSSTSDVSNIPKWPSYLRLVATGELERRIQNATNMFSACVACGRFCEVDRLSKDPDDWGECRLGEKLIVSAFDAHFGEEPVLKGVNGSGTIFLGACNLKCVYCQNWKISAMDQGEVVDDDRLAEMMMSLQERGCHNINFVSPTHNVLPILRGILAAAKKGLKLPVVWNTGGYDSVASLRLLEGVIDIYMPDAKYASRAVARKLSKVDNYPEINQAAIKEMHRQVGDLQIDPRTGLAWRGVLVRHLVLPSELGGTDDVAEFLANEVGVNTYTHVMDYYRPEHEAANDKKYGLNRKPSYNELQDAHKKARFAGLQRLLWRDD